MADPGFPVGGRSPRGGHLLPMQLCFVKFVCQNERIGTHGGGAAGAPPGSATGREPIFKHVRKGGTATPPDQYPQVHLNRLKHFVVISWSF